jgi:hypothetical protein
VWDILFVIEPTLFPLLVAISLTRITPPLSLIRIRAATIPNPSEQSITIPGPPLLKILRAVHINVTVFAKSVETARKPSHELCPLTSPEGGALLY